MAGHFVNSGQKQKLKIRNQQAISQILRTVSTQFVKIIQAPNSFHVKNTRDSEASLSGVALTRAVDEKIEIEFCKILRNESSLRDVRIYTK